MNVQQLENELWEAADHLRANSKLTAAEYAMPVLGLIFLRHADNRFKAYLPEIEADYLELAAQLGLRHVRCIPISALDGDNVMARQRTFDSRHVVRAGLMVEDMNAARCRLTGGEPFQTIQAAAAEHG